MPCTVTHRQQGSPIAVPVSARTADGGRSLTGPGRCPDRTSCRTPRVQDHLDLHRGQQRDQPGRSAAEQNDETGLLPSGAPVRRPGNITATRPPDPVQTITHRDLVSVGMVAVETTAPRQPSRWDRRTPTGPRFRQRPGAGAARRAARSANQVANKSKERRPETSSHARPRRRQVLPRAGQGRGIGTGHLWPATVGHPQEPLVFLLNQAGRKVVPSPVTVQVRCRSSSKRWLAVAAVVPSTSPTSSR